MSVQKLIAEAEKLLDKKKPAEAIDRLKSALAQEPLNQLVVSRLANIYLEQNDRPSAARAYSDLARRLGQAGKSAVAIALYKQAIDIYPENMEFRVAYARECEEMGKVGDAQAQGQLALQYFLRRKKYLEAADVMPLLVRLNPRDDLKAAWIETIQLSYGEQKLPHLLVALCGPPGIISTEFNVGGDAASLSEGLYESLKSLVRFFPRDPRLPYALAWAAERQGRKKDFYDLLREALRREPDFCLGYLLLARHFADSHRLSEALYVFKILKERMGADRSVDMATLSHLVNAFAEKSPWITMGDTGGARELEPADFLRALGAETAPSAFPPPIREVTGELNVELAELSSPASVAPAPAPVVPLPEPEVLVARPPAPPVAVMVAEAPPPELIPTATSGLNFAPAPPVFTAAPEPVAEPSVSFTIPEVAAAPASAPASAPPQPAPGGNEESVEFTNIIKVDRAELDAPDGEAPFAEAAAEAPAGDDIDPSALLLAAEEPAAPSASTVSAKGSFNPFAGLDAGALSEPTVREDKTEIFSPMDVLSAQGSARARYDHVKTQVIGAESIPAPVAAAEEAKPRPDFIAGEATQLFSPMEAVAAAGDSRRAPSGSATISFEPQLDLNPAPAPAAVVAEQILEPAEATMMMPSLASSLNAPVSPSFEENVDPDGATQILSAQDLLPADLFSANDLASSGDATRVVNLNEPSVSASPVISFQPIPSFSPAPEAGSFSGGGTQAPQGILAAAMAELDAEGMSAASSFEELPDLGDDLLQEPTRVLVAPPKLKSPPESTRHLLQEIRQEIRENKSTSPDADAMLRRAERYIVKQNYYLARKALRMGLELGADGERVQARLRDIRKLELPTGLYHASSDDERERSSDILERLELDFDIREDAEAEPSSESLRTSVDQQLERIFQENDSRTLLDFGVGLHEMGLFAQAEEVFTRITTQFPEHAFDAYYLAAVAKFSRRDYAGAASILKHLSGEPGRSEEEKIQIYYTLGETFERMRRPESREYFEKVAGIDANYRNVRNKLEG